MGLNSTPRLETELWGLKIEKFCSLKTFRLWREHSQPLGGPCDRVQYRWEGKSFSRLDRLSTAPGDSSGASTQSIRHGRPTRPPEMGPSPTHAAGKTGLSDQVNNLPALTLVGKLGG